MNTELAFNKLFIPS